VADELPELIVAEQTAWRHWLAENHGQSTGVWLVLAKKGNQEPTALRYDEALDEALCHGWIDGQVRRRDDRSYRQRFTPRRARSSWSARNVEIVAQLQVEGRMHPAGTAAVEQARADGRLERAYPGQSKAKVPDDLQAALDADPAAAAMFEILTAQNRYAILHRLHEARRADTRARRIEEFTAMLARGETLHPQRRRRDS
jgi:uncharacterized protein YdeI (YjbR/CyaY-like superfamily)